MSCFDTVFPADSVEFCPHPAARDILVCGTYKLDQSESAERSLDSDDDDDNGYSPGPPVLPVNQSRRGKCLLFRIASGDSGSEQPSLLQETALPAVLDMKWCHRSASVSPLLAVADSEGGVSLHEYKLDESRLDQIQTLSCAPPHVLCLSLDWSNRRHSATTLGNLVISQSNGSLSLARPRDDTGLAVTDSWHAHDFEPWIAAWDYGDGNVIYSGGDDLKMRAWDIRQDFSRPLFVNKRFEAGITSIQSHPYIDHIIAVGSYDSTVRLFDTRRPLTPLSQADVGGGAWRVKWHPSAKRQGDLLVACMHDGFKVVRFHPGGVDGADGAQNWWEIAQRFDKHESLAYGVDWSCADGGDDGSTLVASCSFYDHTIHLWKG
ncbi:WD-40 repeat-containing protein [Amylocystis lapponica]|nr:WD-40 repeat-containing protein [Amylocystis lapponica]